MKISVWTEFGNKAISFILILFYLFRPCIYPTCVLIPAMCLSHLYVYPICAFIPTLCLSHMFVHPLCDYPLKLYNFVHMNVSMPWLKGVPESLSYFWLYPCCNLHPTYYSQYHVTLCSKEYEIYYLSIKN